MKTKTNTPMPPETGGPGWRDEMSQPSESALVMAQGLLADLDQWRWRTIYNVPDLTV